MAAYRRTDDEATRHPVDLRALVRAWNRSDGQYGAADDSRLRWFSAPALPSSVELRAKRFEEFRIRRSPRRVVVEPGQEVRARQARGGRVVLSGAHPTWIVVPQCCGRDGRFALAGATATISPCVLTCRCWSGSFPSTWKSILRLRMRRLHARSCFDRSGSATPSRFTSKIFQPSGVFVSR